MSTEGMTLKEQTADLATLESLRECALEADRWSRKLDCAMHSLLVMGEPISPDKIKCIEEGYRPDEQKWPRYTYSIDAAVGLVERVLPGWWITCGLCSLTGHASIGPDYNGPHQSRLFSEFPQDVFDGGFHEDLAPGDGHHRVCYAILATLLSALIARAALPKP